MPKTLQAVGKNVIVRRREKTQSQGGLFLPTETKGGLATGLVISVAAPEEVDLSKFGLELDTSDLSGQIKAGDTVLFAKDLGVEIDFEGDKLVVLKDDNIIAVIKENE